MPAEQTSPATAVELLVVGAGPAGLAAASEATRAGVRTLLVDAGEATGGQYYAREPGKGWNEGLPPQLTAGAQPELLDVRLRTAVWGAFGDTVALVCDGRSERVKPAATVIATGGVERPLPFPGWDRPGVMAPGALQRMLKVSRAVPNGRVVVAGSGPFLLAVAADLRAAGADVCAVVEQRRRRDLAPLLPAAATDRTRRRDALRFARVLRGVPMRFGAGVGAAVPGGLLLTDGTTIEADVACVGHGFLPRLDLARMLGALAEPGGVLVTERLQSSRSGVFAAGEATGIGGAPLAAAEGRLAGLGAAEHLGRPADPVRRAELERERAVHARFAARLARVYPDLPVLDRATAETTICRCEQVTLGDLRGAIALPVPADDLRAAKADLRCGMGACQGAMCAEAVRAAVGSTHDLGDRRTPRARPPLAPITVGSVADAGAER